MAARKEILADLSTKIADGKMREAYRTFEELPIADQIAVSLSPGVGDALAVYEVGEFGARAKKNLQEDDLLGALGNTSLSALSGISLIPLFRVLRGARGVTKSGAKALDTPTKAKPPVGDPLQLSAPKVQEVVDEVELPEVIPFQKKFAPELTYQLDPTGTIAMQSKARNFLHGHFGKIGKLDNASIDEWIEGFKKAGVPEGELRILNILDQFNEPNQKLLNELAGQEKISKGFLDNYMARQQRDALQVRNAPPGQLEGASAEYLNKASKATQQQKLYFVRGAGDQRGRTKHYTDVEFMPIYREGEIPQKITGNTAYAFDGVGTNKPLKRYEAIKDASAGGTLPLDRVDFFNPESLKTIEKGLKELNMKPEDKYADIFRVQSDFVSEVGSSKNFINPKGIKKEIIEKQKYNTAVDQINPILAANPDAALQKKLRDSVLAIERPTARVGDAFELNIRDVEIATNKPYQASVQKTPEEIFYMLDDTGSVPRQKYANVPDDPDQLKAAYLNDVINPDEKAFSVTLDNGTRLLRKYIIPEKDTYNFGSGNYRIDPYFEKSTTNTMKLPVRYNILEALARGDDGIHIGSAQAAMEGSPDAVIQRYAQGEKEINKVLEELGLSGKPGIKSKINNTLTEFDGTYLKFTDEFKDAVAKKGIYAFKDGGRVDIDAMLAEL
tara:strand:- start:239 stop:2251 length:2013 start_codon:yes stop_codon:yes gene_type:complete